MTRLATVCCLVVLLFTSLGAQQQGLTDAMVKTAASEVTATGLTQVHSEPKWSEKSQPSDLFLLVFQKPS